MLKVWFAVVAGALAWTACSAQSFQPSIPRAAYTYGISAAPGLQYLYVSNTGGDQYGLVSVYRLGDSTPTRTIPNTGGGQMIFDNAWNLIVTMSTIDSGFVKSYLAGTAHLIWDIQEVDNSILGIDSGNYLYRGIADDGVVEVYAPKSSVLLHTIRQGLSRVSAIAVDRNNVLYVASGYYGMGAVAVYEPTSRPGYPRLARKIEHVRTPVALALGPSGNLFVANDQVVYVFEAGSYKLLRSITGLRNVKAIAVDSVGRLYVSSVPFTNKGFRPGWIDVFEPGKTHPQRRITSGVNVVYSMAIDARNNLYAANLYGDTVTVYPPGGAKTLRTITDGIAYPSYVAIASR